MNIGSAALALTLTRRCGKLRLMLEQLRIENFKAWRDTGDIQLAPLTIFFGQNSSGKSSLLQPLLLLQQSAQSSDVRQVLNFGDSRSMIDLGSFADVIHGHDLERALRFQLGWKATPNADNRFRTVSQGHPFVSFDVSVRQDAAGPLYADSIRYRLGSNAARFESELLMKKINNDEYEYVSRSLVDDNSAMHEPMIIPSPYRFYAPRTDPELRSQRHWTMTSLSRELEHLLDRIHYVSAYREPPQRLYRRSGDATMHVGKYGERAVDALLASSNRSFSRRGDSNHQSLSTFVSEWLEMTNIIESFRVQPIAEKRAEHEVLIRAFGTDTPVNLMDAGFGISQVLPIIIECFCVAPNSVVILEQPELHLHPTLQADLADLFIDALHTYENGQPRNIQFIIESHSEHLLCRLQRRIAEQHISPDAVAIHYCDPPRVDGVNLRRIQHDKYGRIREWPPKFFGDIIGDTEKQVRSTLARMQDDQEHG